MIHLSIELHICPCGYYGDPTRPGTCSSTTVTRYQKRISGPLMDRIGNHMQVPRVEFQKLRDIRPGEIQKYCQLDGVCQAFRPAPAAVDRTSLPPGAEALKNDRRSCRLGGDHPGAPGRGAAVPTKAGLDVKDSAGLLTEHEDRKRGRITGCSSSTERLPI